MFTSTVLELSIYIYISYLSNSQSHCRKTKCECSAFSIRIIFSPYSTTMSLYYFLRDTNTNGPNLLVYQVNTVFVYRIIVIPYANKKSYVNDNEVQNQELLTLDTISPIWVKLKANYCLYYLRRLQLYLEIKYTSKVQLDKHMVFRRV